MYTIDRLEPGYYPDIRRGPSANPAKGSLDCSAGTRGCNKVVGWYVVDSVAFTNDVIQAVELRFEQLCEGLAHNRLRGAVRWER
jgi:hypothetical protein